MGPPSLVCPRVRHAPPKLYHLDLSSNALHGAIPASVGELGELRYLNLRSNSLGGSLPHSVGAMLDLHYLILADNRISVRAVLPSTTATPASVLLRVA